MAVDWEGGDYFAVDFGYQPCVLSCSSRYHEKCYIWKTKGEWLDSVCLQTCEKTAPREMCQSSISKKRKPAVKTAVKTRRNVDRGNQLKGEGISNTFQQNTYSEAKQLYHSSIVTRENA